MVKVLLLVLLSLFTFSCSHGPINNPHLYIGKLETYTKISDEENVIEIYRGNGTGFAIGKHEILTAGHVCESLNEPNSVMYLTYFDGKSLQKLEEELIPIYKDLEKDLCILSIKNNPLKVIEFANKPSKIWSKIYTFGFPKGMSFVLTSGFYGYNVDLKYMEEGKKLEAHVTSLSLAVFYGNSGGPILNEKGEFVGILIAIHGQYHHISYTPRYDNIKTFLEERYK